MAPDEILLRGAAWLSLAAWAAGEWWRAGDRCDPARRRARIAWTTGAVALAAHTALAFQLRHGWSHAAALEEIARQTERVTGLAYRGGVYFNYAFALLWAAEVVWWWRAPTGFLARPRAIEYAVRSAFLIMFANGAILFADGPVRVLGVLALGGVVWAWSRATPGVAEAEHA